MLRHSTSHCVALYFSGRASNTTHTLGVATELRTRTVLYSYSGRSARFFSHSMIKFLMKILMIRSLTN